MCITNILPRYPHHFLMLQTFYQGTDITFGSNKDLGIYAYAPYYRYC
jgi:hypothetical protein